MRKKLSPLVEAMNMYSSLDERDKQTLTDWIRSQTPAKPKPKAEMIPLCITCGYSEESSRHYPVSGADYHPFIPLKKPRKSVQSAGKKSSRKDAETKSIPSLETAQANAGIAAGASGD